MIKRIQNAYYVVADMERAVRFYRDALGLKLKFQDGAKWAQFDGVNANFSLSSPEESAGDGHGAIIVFEVEDIDAAARRIEEGGGAIISRRDMGAHGCTLAFRDPAGNTVQLFARRKPA